MLGRFFRKDKSNISDNQNEKVKFLTNKNKSTHASILNYFGFNDFNHETYFTDFVAENNANLYNAPLEINNETIKQYLIQQEFYRKNWNSIFKLSKLGISGYLIFIANDDLYFQVVDIQQRVYDITGKLIQCTIFYDSYEQNAQTVRLFEIYTLNNEQITINRAIYSISDNKKQFPLDFKSFINNPNLEQEQTLNINYIPIAIMRNKANELADCNKVMDKIKALDVIYEQIVLDTILNSPKFIFSQTYGNVQSTLEEAVRTLVTKNYIFKSGGDNNEQNENINMTNSNFKGKNLTDIYDWNVNEIFKRCGIHIPSQKKSAQQSVPESTAVNISTINYIEQKLWQFNIDILKFIQILVSIDKDLLNSKTFNINDEQEINNLTVKLKLYAVSINEPLTENNISNLYIINNYSQPYQNPKTRSTKSITIIKIKDFKTRDGYPIIIKLQKPLDKDTKVIGLKIKAPRSMIFGNIKVLGEVDNMEVYPKLFVKDKIAFPLLSMPIETQPKVRILQQWFSEQILPWNLAKQFIGQEKSVLDLIAIGGGKETRKEIIKNARVTHAWLGYFLSSYSFGEWPLKEKKELKDKEVWKIQSGPIGKEYTSIATYDKFDDIEVEISDKPPIDSLQKLLLDMLSYTYNYNRNFEGATYNDKNGKPLNDIAILRAKFEGQKPDEVITNLFKQWELDYPNYVNLPQMQIFKQVFIMLSKYIYSSLSINKGLNDDNKILLPYYFELKSSPIHPTKDKIWQYKDVKVILKSAYFDLTNVNNIKLKNNDISQNELFKLDDNQFNWLSITNELESNNIPSLIPADWTLGNGEYGKYFTKLIISNNKIENALNLYGSNKSQLFSKLEFYKEISQIDNNSEFELQIENPINNLNRIEISGIFGAENYDFILITDKQEIDLKNINLFDKYNENISYINLEI